MAKRMAEVRARRKIAGAVTKAVEAKKEKKETEAKVETMKKKVAGRKVAEAVKKMAEGKKAKKEAEAKKEEEEKPKKRKVRKAKDEQKVEMKEYKHEEDEDKKARWEKIKALVDKGEDIEKAVEMVEKGEKKSKEDELTGEKKSKKEDIKKKMRYIQLFNKSQFPRGEDRNEIYKDIIEIVEYYKSKGKELPFGFRSIEELPGTFMKGFTAYQVKHKLDVLPKSTKEEKKYTLSKKDCEEKVKHIEEFKLEKNRLFDKTQAYRFVMELHKHCEESPYSKIEDLPKVLQKGFATYARMEGFSFDDEKLTRE
jgi:hypothetical protein